MDIRSIPSNITKAGLFLFAFSLPISHVPAQIGIGLALLGWLGEGLFNGRWQVRWHFFFFFLGFYIAWNILAALISSRPTHSLAAVVDNEWPLFVMLMMFWTITDVTTLKRLVSVMLASSSITMMYAIWQAVGGVEVYRGMRLDPIGFGYFRAVGFYGFYLTFAAFAMSVFFLSAAFFVEMKDKRRWKYGLSALLSFVAVVGTFARSIWLSFASAIPLFAFSRSKKMGIIVTASLFGVAVLGIMTVPALRYRAASIVDVSQNETRLNLWKTALAMSSDHPLIGIGEDNWDYHFENYRVEGYYDTVVHPHNDYLTALVSSGYPGLIAFVGMWGVALYVGYRSAKRAKDEQVRSIALGSTFSILGFLVGSLFQNYYGTFVNCLGWWFMVGLIFSAHSLSGRMDEER